jgi:EmrB/QacA subfamily drug resistance transporter
VIRYGTAQGRWVILAAVLGSGVAFLDSTVVNVALPAIAADLHTDVRGLQWVVDAYLVTLSALLLLGGSLGDLYGRRRMFVLGLVLFTAASVVCGAAPNMTALIGARALQGAGAALLVPGSLAIISAVFHPDDRSTSISAWSGMAGIATAVGPFVGGWLISSVSWRLVFFINVPLAAAAVAVALRHVPETRDESETQRVPDLPGAAVVAVGLGGLAYGLIESQSVALVIGAVALVLFVAVERRRPHPMLPLDIFRSHQFVGANLTTLAVYAALGGVTFMLVLELQQVLGYAPTGAGAALLPATVILLVLSARMGRMAQRTGPRLPMTIGPVVVGAGLLLMGRVGPGSSYVGTVLPGVVVFGLGLAITVGPLTSAVLAAVEDRHLGVGSAFNNAVARAAGLLAVAVLPRVAGYTSSAADTRALADGFPRAARLGAALCVVGAGIAWATIRNGADMQHAPAPALDHGCADPSCVKRGEAGRQEAA